MIHAARRLSLGGALSVTVDITGPARVALMCCKMQVVEAAKDKYKFQPCWKWPRPVQNWIEKRMRGYSLHVCCGSSTLGDVRIDLHKETATIKGDMFHLPFKFETFDCIICDPPWNLSYRVRHLLSYELRDMLKPGGSLFFNALWYPKARGLKFIECNMPEPQYCRWHRNFAIILHCKKLQAQLNPYLVHN